MKKIRTICLIASAAVLLASFGCSRNVTDVPPVAATTREVRDDLGKTVTVPLKLERAISLAPSVTEMVFAIGAGDRLVGVTTYCNYPPEAASIEKVGDTQTPNMERIVALRPQIVFVSTASQLEAFSRTLEEQGIAVYVTNPLTLDDVFKNLMQLGELFDRADFVEGLVASLGARTNAVAAASADVVERPRVFVQISKEPLFTIGKESFLTELVAEAGGVSVTANVATAYPTISKETALALDPQVIFLSDSEDNAGPSQVFASSPAVKNSRVYRINADIISRPGPRLVDALEEIARKLRQTD